MNENPPEPSSPPADGALGRALPAWPWPAAAFLLSITVLAYLPAILNGGFIWDDDAYIPDGALQSSLTGLRHIWTKAGLAGGGTIQYYPLTYSAFWAEHRLFQLQPPGYHLINVLLHALNAAVIWRILLLLRVPGALLAAGIFALHPVHVESVAWITELKNVLSGLFYLLSLLYYLKFLAPDGAGRRTFYFLALFLFVCALASKTVTATLPAVILLIMWWKTGRVGRSALLATVPMFLLAAGAGLFTAHLEKMAGAGGYEWALTPVEHLLLAGRILLFYAGKLIRPDNLAFIYPRWTVSASVWWQYLFPLAAVAALAVLWAARDKIGRGPLTAALFFTGTLAPVLGFLNVYPMRFSYVADHFQYLASLGPITLFAALAARSRLWTGGRGPDAGPTRTALFLAGALLLTLGLTTCQQSRIYENADRVWADTLKKNPGCWLAHGNLGASLVRQGWVEEGVAHYREAVRLKPDYAEARYNLGNALTRQGRAEEAITQYREALRTNPDFAQAHNNLALGLCGQGKTEEGVRHYREALRLKPDFAKAHRNLGTALAGQGRTEEAAAHYREALRLDPAVISDAGRLWPSPRTAAPVLKRRP